MIARIISFFYGVLGQIVRPVWHEFVEAVRFLTYGPTPNNQTPREIYVASLQRIFFVVVGTSIVFVVFGTIFGYLNWSWGILIAFLIWAVPMAIFLFAVSPIGLALYAVKTRGALPAAAEEYSSRCWGILAGGLSFTVLLMLVSLGKNPKYIPWFLLGSIVVGFMTAIVRRLAITIACAVILIWIGSVLAFWWPLTAAAVHQRLGSDADNTMAAIVQGQRSLFQKSSGLDNVSLGLDNVLGATAATSNVSTPSPRAMIIVSEEEAAKGFTLMTGMTAQTFDAKSIEIDANHEYLLLDTQFNEYRKPAGHDRLVQSTPGPLTIKAIHDNTAFKIRRS